MPHDSAVADSSDPTANPNFPEGITDRTVAVVGFDPSDVRDEIGYHRLLTLSLNGRLVLRRENPPADFIEYARKVDRDARSAGCSDRFFGSRLVIHVQTGAPIAYFVFGKNYLLATTSDVDTQVSTMVFNSQALELPGAVEAVFDAIGRTVSTYAARAGARTRLTLGFIVTSESFGLVLGRRGYVSSDNPVELNGGGEAWFYTQSFGKLAPEPR